MPSQRADSKLSSKANQKALVKGFFDRYEVGKTLGVGGFSVVKEAVDRQTGDTVAIKVVERCRYQYGDKSLKRETDILKKVNHPNCIRLYNIVETDKRVYIVTELVSGGELLDRVISQGNYSEQDAAGIIRQLVDGVAYLHNKGIVHRDLKLENILLQNDSNDAPIKIADFGLSKCFAPNDVLSTMCGSPQYVAPEILLMSDGISDQYSPACDMWSVGVILFILLSGYSPFDDEVDAVLFSKIKSGKYDADDPVWDSVSAEAKDLIAGLLVVASSQRLTAQQALSHPWLQGHCSTTSIPGTQLGLKNRLSVRGDAKSPLSHRTSTETIPDVRKLAITHL